LQDNVSTREEKKKGMKLEKESQSRTKLEQMKSNQKKRKEEKREKHVT